MEDAMKRANKLSVIRLTLLYATVLILVTYGSDFAFAHLSLGTFATGAIRLLSSPFNAHFEGDYANNIAFPIVLLLVTELYLRARGRDRLVSNAFWASIIASYVLSADFLVLKSLATAGSSIVGESIFVVFAASVFVDSLRFLLRTKENVRRYRLPTYTTYSVASAIGVVSPAMSALFYYGAWLGVSIGEAFTHLLGLLGFVIVFSFMWRRKR